MLTNGDTISGFIESFGSNGISIDSAIGISTLPIRHVVSVALASAAAPERSGPHVLVTLRHSGRVLLTELEFAGASVQGRMPDGTAVRVEADRIVQVEFVGGRWAWLTAHQPISFEHTPMLS
ncbi:hypothetical protein IIC65_07145, partial [Candidatus Sumerlaeota bacterium]|nr:hypothetical protein [Candidatus Sumerlaeota bacterium]